MAAVKFDAILDRLHKQLSVVAISSSCPHVHKCDLHLITHTYLCEGRSSVEIHQGIIKNVCAHLKCEQHRQLPSKYFKTEFLVKLEKEKKRGMHGDGIN